MSSASSQPVLMVTGASYAAGWQPARLPGYVVVNRGKGGEDTAQVRARFDADLEAVKPAAVLIWGHINNIHRAPEGTRAAARDEGHGRLSRHGGHGAARGVTVMFGTEVTLSEASGFMNRVAAFVGNLRGKHGYSEKVNAEVMEINRWLREYGRAEGIRVLDFEKVFDDGEGFRKREFNADDGSHINAEGYDALTEYATRMLGEAPNS